MTDLKLLPATKTRTEWGYTLSRTWDSDLTWDAELVVYTCTGKRIKRWVEDKYLVEEVPAIGFDGRAFLLCREEHSGDLDLAKGRLANDRTGNVYECHVHRDGFWKCTCDAGRAGKSRCLHEICLRDLVSSGGWEHPLEG